MFSTKILTLVTILNNTLYIYKPDIVHHCFISIDYYNTRNDSWPENWKEMMQHEANKYSASMCSINISGNQDIIHYKIIYTKADMTMLNATNNLNWNSLFINYNLISTQCTFYSLIILAILNIMFIIYKTYVNRKFIFQINK